MYGRQPRSGRNQNLWHQDRPLAIVFIATFAVVNGICAWILPHYVGSWSWTKNNVHMVSGAIGALIAATAGLLVIVVGRLIRKSRRSP